jgi:ferric-dicitrate binding protein FerR (iron transport regulator)
VKRLPEHIIKSLIDFESGLLDSDEVNNLAQWLDANEQAIKEANEYVRLSNHLRSISTYQRIDSEKSWLNVAQKTSDKPGWRKQIRLNFYKQIAAIVLPLITLGTITWYLLTMMDGSEHQIAEQVRLQTGGSKAILELPNGQTVNLGGDKTEQILVDNIKIASDSVNLLSYSKQLEITSQFNTLIVPKGGEYQLKLADGTHIWLNSETKLIYPTNFDGDTREIQLIHGEIYLEVAENKQKPFIVKGDDYNVKVLGTGFNIRNYKDEDAIKTTLVHGSVRVSSEGQNYDVILKPNQQLVNYDGDVDVDFVDVQQVTGWIKGTLFYSNVTLDDIMRDLARWYQFEYEFADADLAELRFGGGISRYDNIEKILDIIATTKKIDIAIHNEKILFKRK